MEITIKGTQEELQSVLEVLAGSTETETPQPVVGFDPEKKVQFPHPGPKPGNTGIPDPPNTSPADKTPVEKLFERTGPDAVPDNGDEPLDELDAAGQPWDEQIHASSKSRLAKTGCWKLKRGVDTALVMKVQAENAPHTTPAATERKKPTNFVEIFNAVNEKIAAGETTMIQTNAQLVHLGVPEGLPGLGTKPDLWGPAVEVLGL